MLSCIAGAIIAACNPTANIVIAGPVGYATQGGAGLYYYALPIQFVPPVIIIRRA
jgi:hypothetical protein